MLMIKNKYQKQNAKKKNQNPKVIVNRVIEYELPNMHTQTF